MRFFTPIQITADRRSGYVAYVFVFLGSIIICRYEPFETKPKIFTWSALPGGPKKLFCRGRTRSRSLWIEDHESCQNIAINSTS